MNVKSGCRQELHHDIVFEFISSMDNLRIFTDEGSPVGTSDGIPVGYAVGFYQCVHKNMVCKGVQRLR